MRYFNTEGPVDPSDHYCIPALDRVDLDEILLLIRWKKYFIFHAPRQTGKTSTLLALADRLNAAGECSCVYVNFEVGQTAREDVPEAIRVVLGQIAERAEAVLQDTFVRDVRLRALEEHGGHGALNVTLAQWARASDRRDRHTRGRLANLCAEAAEGGLRSEAARIPPNSDPVRRA